MDVLRRIWAFAGDKWAAEVAFGTTTAAAESANVPSSPGLRGWQTIAIIFQSAVAIYCIASLLHDLAADSETPTARSLRPEALAGVRGRCRSVLIDRLREATGSPLLRRLLFWPLVVAGVEAEDESDRRFVLNELLWTSGAFGTVSPLVAKDFLTQRVWALGLGRGAWDALFDQPYMFVL